jgi:hypothetical protein
MGKRRGACRCLVSRLEGRRSLGRPRRRWEDNTEMDLQEIGWGDKGWIDLAQDWERWRALVNAVMNLLVPKKCVKFFLLTKDVLALQEGRYYV